MNKKAIIIFSGGMDSATVLAHANANNYECYALTFDYGQSLIHEIEASKKICASMSVKEHRIIKLDKTLFKNSALTDASIDVPQCEPGENEIPVTYVPARNTVFLSMALAYAESINAFDIFIGVNMIDYSNYPDCRSEYIDAFQKMSNLATKAGVENSGKFVIHTPLIDMSKTEIIKYGDSLGVDFSITLSCYNPNEHAKACGLCSSCEQRKAGFIQADIQDTTNYQFI